MTSVKHHALAFITYPNLTSLVMNLSWQRDIVWIYHLRKLSAGVTISRLESEPVPLVANTLLVDCCELWKVHAKISDFDGITDRKGRLLISVDVTMSFMLKRVRLYTANLGLD